jgi:hypothetical protein
MSRPALLPLPDEQAALLVRALQPLLIDYPAGGRDHRPFVREFIRAAHTATGRTFSAPIYRKLLAAYAPGRSPSTDTLAAEKRAFDASLADEAVAGRALDAETGVVLGAVVERAVGMALARQGRAPHADAAGEHHPYRQAQLDFLQARLGETEQMLADVRTQAARLAAELQAAQAVRAVLEGQVGAANALALEQAKRLEQLTVELAGMRKFAMTAIDSARGETRAQQERAAHLDALLKMEKEHTEVFRRLAYRSGAPIPHELLAPAQPSPPR